MADVPFDYRHRRCVVYDVSGVRWQADLHAGLTKTISVVLSGEAADGHLHWPEDVRRTALGIVLALSSRQDAYRAVPRLISEVNVTHSGRKQLLIAALHGHEGDRVIPEPEDAHDFREFDEALMQCIHSRGPDMWEVREMYNVTSEERLAQVVEWVRQAGDCEGYEVRAFCAPRSIPQLAPIIVDTEDCLFGLEHTRYYRVHGAMHIRDQRTTQLVIDYFNALWNNRSVPLFVLRSAVGLNAEGVERLRAYILLSRSVPSERRGVDGRGELTRL